LHSVENSLCKKLWTCHKQTTEWMKYLHKQGVVAYILSHIYSEHFTCSIHLSFMFSKSVTIYDLEAYL